MKDGACENRAYNCLCERAVGHEGNHGCECGGSWSYDDEGEFLAATLPSILSLLGGVSYTPRDAVEPRP